MAEIIGVQLRRKGSPRPDLPLISVVTIVRNDVAHLEKTILSVLTQTYPNIEYVIVDGASTDGTVALIEKYAPYIDRWISEPDKGTHDAINKGVGLVSGEWVNFMHCGDFFYDADVITNIFLKNKICGDLVYGNFMGMVNETESALFVGDKTIERSWQGMVFGHQTLFAKTAIARQFKFDTSYKVSSDFDFVMKCIVNGYTFQKVEVVVFQVGTRGISNNHWLRARIENWRIARRFRAGITTDTFHIRGILYEICFRIFKSIFVWLGLYTVLRSWYRRFLKSNK